MRVAAGLLGALLLLAALPPLVSDAAHLLGRGAGPDHVQVLTSFTDLLSRLPPELIQAEGLAAIAGSGAAASLLRLPAGPCLAALGLLLAALSLAGRRANGRSRQAHGAGEVPDRSGAAHAPQPTTAPSAAQMDAVDREFLPAALELLETPPSPIRVAAIWLICVAFATALAWSYFGWLDIHAIAHGRIQPSGRSKIVQPLEPGKVIAIAVDNGQSRIGWRRARGARSNRNRRRPRGAGAGAGIDASRGGTPPCGCCCRTYQWLEAARSRVSRGYQRDHSPTRGKCACRRSGAARLQPSEFVGTACRAHRSARPFGRQHRRAREAVGADQGACRYARVAHREGRVVARPGDRTRCSSTRPT